MRDSDIEHVIGPGLPLSYTCASLAVDPSLSDFGRADVVQARAAPQKGAVPGDDLAPPVVRRLYYRKMVAVDLPTTQSASKGRIHTGTVRTARPSITVVSCVAVPGMAASP
jgi:hypothetical protein